MKKIRRFINNYAEELRECISCDYDISKIDLLVDKYKKRLSEELMLDEEIIANYVIFISYSTLFHKQITCMERLWRLHS